MGVQTWRMTLTRYEMRKNNRTPQEKIRACKALQGKTVEDVCRLPGFRSNLEAYVTAQREEWRVLREHAALRNQGEKKFRPKSHPMDGTVEWTMDKWVDEVVAVLHGYSKEPAAVREYVRQLGIQAYNVTCANLVLLEFPELREYFFGKSKVV